ncbi:uncharacterized protein MICPUCDRAFT_24728 [Micromonas pusilla CCMP1545]|uniref:peptidylprolyl isomerase n=1 Tax=Micromonas pusilla (strain CCMP1545) TaxID=564608 RepID=C1MK93_MICPC|nr:uncharacterized protein MICPUCDRAFT_24728 [Micromonas pusilla CCMP1545]EEH59721.1 predicted protein [Micromonas pusilla CCMP1545]|mmetsp:Transcript_3144/g.10496  ORF Transcript_3144/g.10496 Transcript_3144/m.10496 type:complete len:223 (-) Transcript_3144:1585-2253(-)|eukprot:XP_003056345.1 predicted protein [Micromonas pusilla CCMP1545]
MASVVVVASPAVRPRVVTLRASRPRTATIVNASASAPSSSSSTRRVALLTPALAGAFVAAIGAGSLAGPRPARADSLPDEQDVKLLCDAACEETLKTAELVTTPSGLQYRDVVVGDGAKPEPGFQVVVDYIAKNEAGLIFDNSLEKGKPNDIRVTGDPTSSLVIPGLDEGILTMRSGGVRRLYIPGELAFPKGLASAPGRPRISPFSPVVFDVKLIYIPGLE